MNDSGTPGFEVLNPIIIDGENYLLNRGWIPFEKKDTPEINIFNDLKEGKLQRLKTLNCFESQYLYTKNNKEMMKLKEELIEEVVRLMPSQLPANLVSG